MKRFLTRTLLLCHGVLTVTAAHAERITYSFLDDRFLDSEWGVVHDQFSGRTITSEQEPGGIGSVNGLRSTDAIAFSFQNRIGYRGLHWWTGATYDPNPEEEVLHIDWSLWDNSIINNHVGLITARQNGAIYWAPASEFVSNSRVSWTRQAGRLLPSSFQRVLGGGPPTLDFSSTGTPISFGYSSRSNALADRDRDNTVRGIFHVDLFEIKVVAERIPEPSTAFLGTMALTAALVPKRRWLPDDRL